MKWRSLEESTPDTATRPLREIYAERKELIAKYVPAEIQAIHARAVQELKQSGIAEHTLQPGSKAPELRTLRPQRKASPLVRSPRRRPARHLLHPRTLVSILRRADGSHERDLSSDQRSRRVAGGDFAADGAPDVSHGRPAQAPLSATERCRKQGRPRVWTGVSGAGVSAGHLPAGVRQPAVCERRRQAGSCRFRRSTFWMANGTRAGRRPHVLHASANPDYTDRPEPAEILSFLSNPLLSLSVFSCSFVTLDKVQLS